MIVAQTIFLGICAAGVTATCLLVLRDQRRAQSYRRDVVKVWAGLWARLAGKAVLARGQNGQAHRGQKEAADLSHDLMVKVGVDG